MTFNSRIVNLDHREQREAPATLTPIGSRILKVIKLTFASAINRFGEISRNRKSLRDEKAFEQPIYLLQLL